MGANDYATPLPCHALPCPALLCPSLSPIYWRPV